MNSDLIHSQVLKTKFSVSHLNSFQTPDVFIGASVEVKFVLQSLAYSPRRQ